MLEESQTNLSDKKHDIQQNKHEITSKDSQKVLKPQEKIFKQPSQTSMIDLEPLASLDIPERLPVDENSKAILKIH